MQESTLSFLNVSDLKFKRKDSKILFDAEECSNTVKNKTFSPKMILQNFN